MGQSQPSQSAKRPAKEKRSATTSEEARLLIQVSPFEPVGKFRKDATMDVLYHITPPEEWTDMQLYHGCYWKNRKYVNDDFVFVANDRSTAHGKVEKDLNVLVGARRLWVARILEIRAADKEHVYARVCWMYSPDELPAGRQPYHGKNELIASNHQDIISFFSIMNHAKVSQWIESDGRERLEALYWREALDCCTEELSAVDLVCRCQEPENPDKDLIGCTNSDCGQWMHSDCLRKDVLQRVYDRLGTDSPHKPAVDISKNTTEADDEQCVAQVLLHTCAKGKDCVFHVSSAHFDAQMNLPTTQHLGDSNLHRVELALSKLSKNTWPTARVSGRGKASQRKPGSKPYLELFCATLRMDDGPLAWEVKDMRPGFSGSVQTWSEPVLCLLCGAKVE